MNEKLFGSWAVGMMLCSVLASVSYAYYTLDNKQRLLDNFRSAESNRTLGVDKKVLAEIDKFEKMLDKLALPAQLSQNTPEHISIFWGMFGDVRQDAVDKLEQTGKYSVFQDNYSVSMTYISSRRRYAVINGGIYRPQDTLPDGGKVLAIARNKVRISRLDDDGTVKNGWVNVDNKAYRQQHDKTSATVANKRSESFSPNSLQTTAEILKVINQLKAMKGKQ